MAGVFETKKPLPERREGVKFYSAISSHFSQRYTGLDLAPCHWLRGPTGCRGVIGPDPSTTLNEIATSAAKRN